MVSVIKRVESYKQPPGGFLDPERMDCIVFDDGMNLGEENVRPTTIGMVVDYLSRWYLTSDKKASFGICLKGADLRNETKTAESLLD